MYKVIILPLAKQDIKVATYWYDSKKSGLGKRFTRKIRSKVLLICKHPKSAAIRYDKTHCAVLDIFPFMIHYVLDDKKQTIIIIGVFHTSVNPEHYGKRK